MQSELATHLEQLLERLRQERDLLDQVILDLERLNQGRKRPRGRPPGKANSEHRPNRTHLAAGSTDIG